MRFGLILAILLCMSTFVMSGCDKDHDNTRYWTKSEVAETRCFVPSKKILHPFHPHFHAHPHPWHPHFIFVLKNSDVDEICDLLTSTGDNWVVQGQVSDGCEDFYVIDTFTFHQSGFVIDIRNEVKLDRIVDTKVRKERYYWHPFTQEEIEAMGDDYDVEDVNDQGEWRQYPDWEPRE